MYILTECIYINRHTSADIECLKASYATSLRPHMLVAYGLMQCIYMNRHTSADIECLKFSPDGLALAVVCDRLEIPA